MPDSQLEFYNDTVNVLRNLKQYENCDANDASTIAQLFQLSKDKLEFEKLTK